MGEGESTGLLSPQPTPLRNRSDQLRRTSVLRRPPRTEKALRSPGWLSHAGRGCCLTWARRARIPANPTAACIISPNSARNRPAIHGSGCGRVPRANAGSARTPAPLGRGGWGESGARWGGCPWEAELPGSGAHSWNGAQGGGQGQTGVERGGGGQGRGSVSRAGLRLWPSPVLRGAPLVQDSPCVPGGGGGRSRGEERASGQEGIWACRSDGRGPAVPPAFSALSAPRTAGVEYACSLPAR